MYRLQVILLVFIGVLHLRCARKCGVAVTPLERIFNPNGRVVGGKTAQPNSWPWIGALVQQKPGFWPYQFCGGTLLNDEWFITAGHCVDSLSEQDIIGKVGVILGENNMYQAFSGLAPPDGFYTISKVIKHENYDDPKGSTNNDIALFKLSRRVRFSGSVSPICLPSSSIFNVTGTTLKSPATGRRVCFVAGWGHVQEGQRKKGEKALVDGPKVGSGSDDLQQVHIEMYQPNECKKKLRGYRFTDVMLCGGFDQGGKDSCQGDSGGPLVCKATSGPNTGGYELHGVVSWGAGCARAGIPGIYASVFGLKTWINDKMWGK